MFDAYMTALTLPAIFTLQLCDMTSTGSQRTGAMVWGGDDAALTTGAYQYTPVVTQSYFNINVTAMMIGSTRYDFACEGATSATYVQDSGSSNLYIPPTVRNALIAAIQSKVSIATSLFTNHYVPLTPYQLSLMPNLVIMYV